MARTLYFAIPLCCLFIFCVMLSAQETETTSEAVPEQRVRTASEAAELGPNNRVFMDSFAEMQELAKRLTAMKIEYQDAQPERRTEIEAVYPDLFQEGLAIRKRTIELGLDAFDETPNRNLFVDNLLYQTVQREFDRENYEESVRIFKRLASSGIGQGLERFYVFAGLSAMLSMQYEEADKWLSTAHESGDLERILMALMQSSRADASMVRVMQTQLAAMPRTQGAWERELEIRKAEAEAAEQDPAKKLPRVEINTTKGRIVLELFENEAPNTVANFITLVEAGFYNNTVFHRVLPNFMAQGGDPTGTGRGGPGYTINCEAGRDFPQARQHFRGSISMANAGRNTNGSQFFLTFVPIPHLDGNHTVFGRVVEGIEVLSDIQRFDPTDEQAMIPVLDRIERARVLNKRDHDYEVRKNPGR